MIASNWRVAAAYLPSLPLLTLPIIATYNPGIGELASRDEYNSANFSDLAASEVLNEPFPYYFPDQNDTANLFPMPQCNGITLEEATIDQLHQYMSQGQLTSVQLIICYMQREYQTREYIKYVLSAISPTGGQDVHPPQSQTLTYFQALCFN